jgi:hypothetical protein
MLWNMGLRPDFFDETTPPCRASCSPRAPAISPGRNDRLEARRRHQEQEPLAGESEERQASLSLPGEPPEEEARRKRERLPAEPWASCPC